MFSGTWNAGLGTTKSDGSEHDEVSLLPYLWQLCQMSSNTATASKVDGAGSSPCVSDKLLGRNALGSKSDYQNDIR